MAEESGVDADLQAPYVAPNLTTAQRIRAILGGSAGNMVEWYDWFAYTGFTLYFASSFFPNGDPTAQLLAAQLPNVVSFLARPMGAWIMGRFADRFGRKRALVVAVLMMCVGSLALALAPTHAQAGMAAPVILVFARLIQGLSVGGQYGAAATYMSEMATRQRRGFWSSFHYVTLIGGQLLAVSVLIALQNIFTEQEIKDGAWRIAFWIGAALAIVVFLIQNSLHETESFKKITEKHPTDVRGGIVVGVLVALAIAFYSLGLAGVFEYGQKVAYGLLGVTGFLLILPLIKLYPKGTLAILGLTAAGTSGFYAYTTYMLKFLQAPHAPETVAHFTKPEAAKVNFVVLTIFMVLQPLFGHLADKFGRKAMLMVGFGLGAIAAYPVFTAISGVETFWMAVLLCSIPLICLSGYTSISAVVKAELFPSHLRALGVALPYAISNAAFGAMVEPNALGWKKDGVEHYFYIYIGILMLVGFLTAALLMRDTRKYSMILED